MEKLGVEEIDQFSHFLSIAIWDIWYNGPECGLVSTRSSSGEYKQFRKYCRNILKLTQLGKSSVIYALYLIQRFVRLYPNITSISGSHYRLLIVSLMSANKYLDDCTYTNRSWSNLIGRPILEINSMEMEFLSCMDYEINIELRDFERWRVIIDGFIMKFYSPAVLSVDTSVSTLSILPRLETPSPADSTASHVTTAAPMLKNIYNAHVMSPPISPNRLKDDSKPSSVRRRRASSCKRLIKSPPVLVYGKRRSIAQ